MSIFISCIVVLILMNNSPAQNRTANGTKEERKYTLERVGPARVVQVYADGFDQLLPKQRTLCYYLYQAAIAGRDIAIDQHHPDALEVRDLFEIACANAKDADAAVLQKSLSYLKLFWINNGFYDNLTFKKFVPECTFEEFKTLCQIAESNGAMLRTGSEPLKRKLERLRRVIFDPAYESTMTEKTPGKDWIQGSGVNFYDRSLTYKEVEDWAKGGGEKNPLNSKVVRQNGKIVEKVWRAGGDGIPPGMYANDLAAVISYLGKAANFAESDYQAGTIRLLMKYLKTGDLDDFRAYNIHWVKDSSIVDFILGFIEDYLDPRGQKAEWEADIFYTNPEQTKLMQNLAALAQYFEDKAPWKDEYKKKVDHSPIANVINIVIGSGGTGPVSPVGINLPNEQAIRQEYGSKSVLLHNVVEAYDKSSGRDMLVEFANDQAEVDKQDKYGTAADNLETALHEVVGHGSGKASEKLGGRDPGDFLPGYYNTLEEARADLMALWNAWDEKLVEIGIAKDAAELNNLAESMYQQAIRVALTQLRRIGSSDQLEEDHMKDRQLIAHFIMQNSQAVKVEKRDGKTYYRIVDYKQAHETVGKLLAEIMRIKAEGDLEAAKTLVNKYGLKLDPELRNEVQERVKKLDAAAYTGFVMPELEPILDAQRNVIDAKVSYPLDLEKQMLKFSASTRKEKNRN